MTSARHLNCPPLLPAFIAMACGILAASSSALPQLFQILTLMAAGIGLSLFFPRSVAALAFLAGLWGMTAVTGRLTPEGLYPGPEQYADGATYYTVTGTIRSSGDSFADRIRYVLDCKALTKRDSQTVLPVQGCIFLTVRHQEGDNLRLWPQDKIQVTTRLRPVRNFSNPGGFDYRRHLRFRGITASAHARAGDIRIMTGKDPPGSPWAKGRRKVEILRQYLVDGIERYAASRTGGAGQETRTAASVLSAMLLGKKNGLQPGLKDRFSQAGVSHILSISGLHLSIVAFFSYFLFWHLLSPCHPLVISGQAHKTALGLSLLPLCIYALLAGFSPATQRALIMVAVWIMAMVLAQDTDPLNTLCLAGIIILAVNPGSLFSISFQLSFAAVGVLVPGMAWISHKGLIPANPVLKYGAATFWVSLFAGVATLPIIARYFNQVSHIQILANLILVPLMGGICLPLGILVLPLLYLWPSMAHGLMNLIFDLLSVCIQAIDTAVGFPLAWSRIITPTWTEIFLYYLALGAIFSWFSRKRKMGVALVAASLTGALICTGLAVRDRFYPEALTVTVLDVGQGASAVVHTPDGQVILIDCGGFSSGTGFDVGRYVVGPYLWGRRIRTLDAVVLSHPQADHMNGLGFILENFTVRDWIINKDCRTRLQPLLAIARKKQVRIRQPGQSDAFFSFGPVRLKVIGAKQASADDLNNNSLVCQLLYDDFSMLFTGDIEAQRESELSQVPDLTSQVMLAPHHGSRDASSKIFLDHVCPESIIVSCGYQTRYRFPHSEVLDAYGIRNIRIFRTDLHGAVRVETRGRGYHMTINREE